LISKPNEYVKTLLKIIR